MKKIFTFLFSLILILPVLANSAYPINNFINENEKIIGKIATEIELQANSDYFIKFDSENLSLEKQSINAYSAGLSEKIKDAIAKSPKWIQRKLTRQFHVIDGEKYADLILETNKKYIDEIAFTIASSSIGNVPPVNLIKDNVLILYENDKWIDYADIVDYDDCKGNYYSTVKYWVLEDNIEKQLEFPPEIYYWYIVHPEIASENAEFIYDEFWRSYLFNHNDIGYPLLKEKLLKIKYLWDCESYSQTGKRLWSISIKDHPTAIEAISYWVGKTVPAQAYGDRPSQPNIISHEHNGWCGELQKIAVAAQRASLIPSVGIFNMGEDHVWREFFERGWHQNDNWWSDGGGTVDIPEVYAYGWKKDMSALFAWKGDESIYEVTKTYIPPEDRKTISFKVLDRRFQPVDGARITVAVWGPNDITWLKYKIFQKLESIWDSLPQLLKGRIIQFLYTKIYDRIDKIPDTIDGPIYSIWNYTNINGECSFQLGHNRSYIFIIQYGNLKKPLGIARYNRVRFLKNPIDKNYNIWLPTLSPIKKKHINSEIPGGNINFKISFDTKSYQTHESILWIDDKGLYEQKGKIDFFILDNENFKKYKDGKSYKCHNFLNCEKDNIIVNAKKNDWYLVFRNKARNSNVILNLTASVEISTNENKVQIVSPNTIIFENPVFNIGEKIILGGIATDDILLKIEEIQYEVTVHNYEWIYEWNTSNLEPKNYTIIAECGDVKDEISVKLIDRFPPEIKINSPTNGEIVEKNIINLNGFASDNLIIEKVEVYIDNGEWKEANGTNNWSIDLNLDSFEIGDHILTARAIDSVGSIGLDEISIVINESGQNWGPIINSFYHKPDYPTNVSNNVIYANITKGSPFNIKSILIIWENGTVINTDKMFRYADNPIQERHEEDPLKNESNEPIYGIELGQFPTGSIITYKIKAIDTAENFFTSNEKSFTILE